MNCWELLGIPPTTDTGLIRRAYARAAAKTHPEDDPEGFKRLRAAYKTAMQYAETGAPPIEPDGAPPHMSQEEPHFPTPPPPRDDRLRETFRSVDFAAMVYWDWYNTVMAHLQVNMRITDSRAAGRAWQELFTSEAFTTIRDDMRFIQDFLGELIDFGHLGSYESARALRRHLDAWKQSCPYPELEGLFWAAASGVAPPEKPRRRKLGPALVAGIAAAFLVLMLIANRAQSPRDRQDQTPQPVDWTPINSAILPSSAPLGEWTGADLPEGFWERAGEVLAEEGGRRQRVLDAIQAGLDYAQVEAECRALILSPDTYGRFRDEYRNRQNDEDMAGYLEYYRPEEKSFIQTELHPILLLAVENEIDFSQVEPLCVLLGISQSQYTNWLDWYDTYGQNGTRTLIRAYSTLTPEAVAAYLP